jgi:hypothetical protein
VSSSSIPPLLLSPTAHRGEGEKEEGEGEKEEGEGEKEEGEGEKEELSIMPRGCAL